MNRVRVLTLFPEMFACLNSSILGRAINNGILSVEAINIRDYSANKHLKCDDVPYGGGLGMVMTPQPIVSAIRALDPKHEARRIYLSPKGRTLCPTIAKELSKKEDLILLCGHYEGVDQRAIDLEIDEEISIGDYVLTGGELAAMVLIDCFSRFIPSVLGDGESADEESFSYLGGILEYPHYTRPQVFEGISVPSELISGNHASIRRWRENKARELTNAHRKDLCDK